MDIMWAREVSHLQVDTFDAKPFAGDITVGKVWFPDMSIDDEKASGEDGCLPSHVDTPVLVVLHGSDSTLILVAPFLWYSSSKTFSIWSMSSALISIEVRGRRSIDFKVDSDNLRGALSDKMTLRMLCGFNFEGGPQGGVYYGSYHRSRYATRATGQLWA